MSALPPTPPEELPVRKGPTNTPESMLRAFTHRPARHPSGRPVGFVMPRWAPDETRLDRYRNLVGSSARMPLAYPALITTALQRDMMSQSDFPVKPMGIVHVGSRIGATAALDPSRSWEVAVWLDPETRHVKGGLELDLYGTVSDGSALWWAQVIVLSRSRSRAGDTPSGAPTLPDAAGEWTREYELVAEEGVGRSYAQLSGDYNLIHLHKFAAKPLGFSRAIAHGWWLTGRAPALMGVDAIGADGSRMEIAFRRPVMLPSTATLLEHGSGSTTEFVVSRPSDLSTVLVGGRVGTLAD